MDNKTKILNSGLELFSLKGYDAVGVQEIAEKSGVGKPTLYHYYGNKEGLLEEILKIHFTEFYEKLQKAAQYESDLTMSLNRVASHYLSYAQENKVFYKMQLSMSFCPSESTPYKRINPYMEKQFKIVDSLFLSAVKDHGNMANRDKQYAVSFLGILNTYIALLLNNRIEVSEDLVHRVVHQFMHGIYS